VLIELREPGDRAVRQLVRELQVEMAGVDVTGCPEAVEFMLGLIDGKPVACGALAQVGPGIGEIIQMYVRPAWRGQGLSRLILAALEERAVELGWQTLRLEAAPNGVRAIRLYEGSGFHTEPDQRGGPGPARYEKSLLPALA
jgi:ribosomal protein S18 acetylase RimI-like enzyme